MSSVEYEEAMQTLQAMFSNLDKQVRECDSLLFIVESLFGSVYVTNYITFR